MKKAFCLFLLSLATLLSVGCNSANDDPTLTSSVETTSTAQADLTSSEDTEPPEATSELKAEAWQPNFDDAWNFTPYYYPGKNKEIPVSDYDIEVTAEPSRFSVSDIPGKIHVVISNKTGTPFTCALYFNLEKLYYVPGEPHDGPIDYGYREAALAWVRLPYQPYNKVWWVDENREALPFNVSLKEGFVEDFELTPGQYRFVSYSAVGTHYAYFEITE